MCNHNFIDIENFAELEKAKNIEQCLYFIDESLEV